MDGDVGASRDGEVIGEQSAVVGFDDPSYWITDGASLHRTLFKSSVGDVLGDEVAFRRDSASLAVAKAGVFAAICSCGDKSARSAIILGLGLVVINEFSCRRRDTFSKPTHFHDFRDATVKSSFTVSFN